MPVEHRGASDTFPTGRGATIGYPTHGLKLQDKDGRWYTACAKALILPSQVPIRGDTAGYLYCIGCRKLVPATTDQHVIAKDAAYAEGFVPPPEHAAPVLPGTLTATARAAIYWKARLNLVAVYTSECEQAIESGRPELEALGLMVDGVLTGAGQEMARLLTDPPTGPFCGDPTYYGGTATDRAASEKKRSRRAWIESLIPRCSNIACYKPVPRDGACACGLTETDGARLAEIVRCWDVVDAKAPEKARKTRRTKAAEAST